MADDRDLRRFQAGLVLVTLALALVQGAVFASGARALLKARQWPQASATIEYSGWSSSSETRLRRSGEPGVGGTRTVSVAGPDTVRFAYAVEGREYQSENLSPFQRWSLGKNSPRYPEEARFAARYDPAAPGDAVLDVSLNSGFWVCAAVTAYLFALFAAAFLSFGGRFGASSVLGGLGLTGIGAGLLLGALVSSTDRPPAEFVAIASFAGLPILLGLIQAVSPWATPPKPLVLVAFLGLVVTVFASMIIVGS